jgi:hypothetical protein
LRNCASHVSKKAFEISLRDFLESKGLEWDSCFEKGMVKTREVRKIETSTWSRCKQLTDTNSNYQWDRSFMKLPLNVALWFCGFILSKFAGDLSMHPFVIAQPEARPALTSAYSLRPRQEEWLTASLNQEIQKWLLPWFCMHVHHISYISGSSYVVTRIWCIECVGEWRRWKSGQGRNISPHLLPYLLLRIYNHHRGNMFTMFTAGLGEDIVPQG